MNFYAFAIILAVNWRLYYIYYRSIISDFFANLPGTFLSFFIDLSLKNLRAVLMHTKNTAQT